MLKMALLYRAMKKDCCSDVLIGRDLGWVTSSFRPRPSLSQGIQEENSANARGITFTL